ncbi:hypothetical protein LSM04_003146 [Trypanosoma melophagium]|uniref:uncharacterized protein n=1 Tax=Trypanosoma melophagium TaxID=715481 RepID=UPI00351A7D85|nr:hypothetical protein LSM04_003146 [Trypanosoma melophagium]
MSRIAAFGRRRFVGPFTRIKAWWLGIEDAELLERYGERGVFRSMWLEWRGVIIVISSGAIIFINHSQANRANEILENIELNRQRHYKRDFAPEYVVNAPAAVYDGAKGYAYRDETSGLMVNADNRLVTDLSRDEQRRRLESAKITPEMVEAARRMRNSPRYQ